MPEGPEVRRAADRLASAVVGQTLTAAWFFHAQPQHYAAQLVGHTITAIEPRGKALLTRFSNEMVLYSHNQLYGQWQIVAGASRPTEKRSLRVALDTAKHSILLYSASDIEIWPVAQIEQHPYLRRLGPDLLDPSVDQGTIEERLRDPRFRRRQLAALLLDQRFLAGMGNYLRSEVLFCAGLGAHLRPADLQPMQSRRLAAALLEIPRKSYRSRGIAPTDGMRSDHSDGSAENFRFKVFGRDGQACEHCSATIVRQELGGRRLYCCPQCQG